MRQMIRVTALFVTFFLLGSLSYRQAAQAVVQTSSELSATTAPPLSAYLPSTCAHYADFVQAKHVPGMVRPVEASGRVVYTCDQGVLWVLLDPIADAIFYGKKSSASLTLGQPVKILKSRVDRAIGQLLNAIMRGDRRELEKNFFVQSVDSGLQLTPKSRRLKKHLEVVDIALSKAAIEVDVRFSQDSKMQLTVTNMQALNTLSNKKCQLLLPEFIDACQLFSFGEM